MMQSNSAPLKTRRSDIQSHLTVDVALSVIQLHPGAAKAYRRLTENLHHAIEGEDGEEVRKELRKLMIAWTSFRWRA